jgi:Uma2 family endonuclease
MPTLVSESKSIRRDLLTAEDFMDWLEPGIHADLIGGEIAMHSPVNLKHATLLNFVDRLLAAYIEKHQLGALFREVVAVKLGSRNVFLPDLLFIPADQLATLPSTHIPYAPPLVVEALSPRTAGRDIGPKFAAYEEHGVREYWVLDPETLDHRFYHRVDGILTAFAEDEDLIPSKVIPGLHLRRTWLNPEQLPTVAECLLSLP